MGTDSSNALKAGTTLKHGHIEYRIERFLGAGGFGITYMASYTVNTSNNHRSSKCAIKEHFMANDCERDNQTNHVICSKPAKQRVEDGKKDFIAEAKRLQKQVKHSNIVQVSDVFETNGTAYYVMEFLDGRSLRSYINKYGECSCSEAISLLKPIFYATGYLHDSRITHLDIKPDNIMIVERESGTFVPILIDFGLSKHYDKNGKPTSTMRTLATSEGYSPIEQYQGITKFQPTADIYALAATMVYCLTATDPKKSADIKPGEFKDMLINKTSDSVLNALLNALKASQYERTNSIRGFLSELCPGESIDSWDKQEDANLTELVMLKKRRKSFFKKIASIFKSDSKHNHFNSQKIVTHKSNNNAEIEYNEPNDSQHIPTTPMYLASSAIGIIDGVVYCIDSLNDYIDMPGIKKKAFKPIVINVIINGKSYGFAAESISKINLADVKTSLAKKNAELNPSGLSGYEKGSCNLPTPNEASLFNNNIDAINTTLCKWDVQPISFPLWVSDGESYRPFDIITTGIPTLNNNLRLLINYYGSTSVYDKNEYARIEMDLFKLISNVGAYFRFHKASEWYASLSTRPEITYSLIYDNLKINCSKEELISQIDHNGKTFFPPADDETPKRFFIKSLKSEPSIIFLPNNELQLINSLILQYYINCEHEYTSPNNKFICRISSPISVYCLWHALNNPDPSSETKTLEYGGASCSYTYNNIDDDTYGCIIEKIHNNAASLTNTDIYNDQVIKGCTMYNLIINGHYQSLLSDIMEYELYLNIENHCDICFNVKDCPLPYKSKAKLPFSIIREAKISLIIGHKNTGIDLAPYFGTVQGSGFANIEVDIDVNKSISLTFINGQNSTRINLGEILLKNYILYKPS